jgi:ribosomal 50S subunit-recycling heat shock protein
MELLSSIFHPSDDSLRIMRLDLFLKQSRLVLRRTVAKEMCDAGAVNVNGHRSKAGHEVKAGDLLSVRQRGRITTVRVVTVPLRQTSKKHAASLYEIIGVQTVE